MRVFNDLKNLPSFRNAVVTIGSFDGVHLGHQEIFKKINDLANGVDGESIVITFHPHPRLVVYPKDDSMKLITTIDEKVQLLAENQSVYIPLGALHRLENPGKVPMVLIEVQTGSYLGEDDIVRYEDMYARN